MMVSIMSDVSKNGRLFTISFLLITTFCFLTTSLAVTASLPSAISKRKSPKIGSAFRVLMTLDRAVSLLLHAVLETDIFIVCRRPAVCANRLQRYSEYLRKKKKELEIIRFSCFFSNFDVDLCTFPKLCAY